MTSAFDDLPGASYVAARADAAPSATSDVFALCRHRSTAASAPSARLCLLSQATQAAVWTLVLVLVLDKKADLEEAELAKKFPDYAHYLLRRREIPARAAAGGAARAAPSAAYYSLLRAWRAAPCLSAFDEVYLFIAHVSSVPPSRRCHCRRRRFAAQDDEMAVLVGVGERTLLVGEAARGANLVEAARRLPVEAKLVGEEHAAARRDGAHRRTSFSTSAASWWYRMSAPRTMPNCAAPHASMCAASPKGSRAQGAPRAPRSAAAAARRPRRWTTRAAPSAAATAPTSPMPAPSSTALAHEVGRRAQVARQQRRARPEHRRRVRHEARAAGAAPLDLDRSWAQRRVLKLDDRRADRRHIAVVTCRPGGNILAV